MKPQFHLPLPTYPDAGCFTVVDNALDLARHNGAELVASIPQVRVPRISPPFPTAIDIDTWRAQAESFSLNSATALKEHLADAHSESGVTVRVHDFEAREPFVFERFARIGRAHDLSIVEASELSRQLSETLLFETGHPIVLFPATSVSSRFDTVAIAWDGSVAAARAVCAARIFMERATRLQVISVTDDKEIDEGDRMMLISALRYSGYQVDDIPVQAYEESPTAALQAAAVEGRADLLVAGGYGHSRFREFILGGVTRDLLVRTTLPTLLAH